MSKKKTSEEIIKESREVHGDFYEYIEDSINGVDNEMRIICPIHGEFKQTPYKHIKRRQGCPDCGDIKRAKNKRKTNERIEKILNICTEKNYEFLGFVGEDYINGQTKLILKCNNCGNIWKDISVDNFIFRNRGCHVCNGGVKLDNEYVLKEIEKKCNEKNLTFLGFKNGEYKNIQTIIFLKCNVCNNIFERKYCDFVTRNASNCMTCYLKQLGEKLRLDENHVIQTILEKCSENNYEFLGFENDKYQTNSTKLIIKCNKCGNIWTPKYSNFMLKTRYCPNCKISFLEQEIMKILSENNVKFEHNRRYSFINALQLDFYIPSKNIAIECQGIQHFKPIDFANKGKEWAEQNYKKIIEYDEKKRKLCEEHGIKLLYYSNLGIDYPYYVFEDKNELLAQIT